MTINHIFIKGYGGNKVFRNQYSEMGLSFLDGEFKIVAAEVGSNDWGVVGSFDELFALKETITIVLEGLKDAL